MNANDGEQCWSGLRGNETGEDWSGCRFSFKIRSENKDRVFFSVRGSLLYQTYTGKNGGKESPERRREKGGNGLAKCMHAIRGEKCRRRRRSSMTRVTHIRLSYVRLTNWPHSGPIREPGSGAGAAARRDGAASARSLYPDLWLRRSW